MTWRELAFYAAVIPACLNDPLVAQIKICNDFMDFHLNVITDHNLKGLYKCVLDLY